MTAASGIRLASGRELPPGAAAQAFGVLGRKGSGKTCTAGGRCGAAAPCADLCAECEAWLAAGAAASAPQPCTALALLGLGLGLLLAEGAS